MPVRFAAFRSRIFARRSHRTETQSALTRCFSRAGSHGPLTYAGRSGPSRMRIRIGCSGWFYSHWWGIFYPRDEPTTKNWFAYYANVFDTVELNASFYRWPAAATVKR